MTDRAAGSRLSPGLLLRLGLRNFVRHRQRNALMVLAIAMAVAGVVLTNSLLRGFQRDLAASVIDNLTGHYKAMLPEYRDDPDFAHSFPLPRAWRPAVPNDLLLGWAPRVRVPAVVMSERETRGVQLVGVDPARETISFIDSVTVDGDRLADASDSRLLLGAALAEDLRTAVGKRVVMITRGIDGRNRERGFRVAGTFDADGKGLERSFAFTGVGALQHTLGAEQFTEVSVRLVRDSNDEALLDRLRKDASNLAVDDWKTLEPQAAAMFLFADSAIYIWFLILMGALSFGLVNTLVAAVMERTREFGVLRAVGMGRSAVLVQVVIESVVTMVVGLAVGIAFGLAAVYALRDGIDLSAWSEGMELAGMRSVLVPDLRWSDVGMVATLAGALAVVASLYPAWRALSIDPLEALRR